MSDLSISWPGYKTDSVSEGDEKKLALKVAAPQSSKVLHAFGDEMTVLLSGADTGGRLAMCLDVTPPEGGPPLCHGLSACGAEPEASTRLADAQAERDGFRSVSDRSLIGPPLSWA